MKKKVSFRRSVSAVLLGIALFVSSCELTPDLDEKPDSSEKASLKSLSVAAASYTLNKVDLITSVGTSVTGTVTVEIRNADGSVVLGSTTVAASTLVKGEATNTFSFGNLALTPLTKYRIYLTRSDAHQPGANSIYWRSTNAVDAYLNNSNDTYPDRITDYGFTVYNNNTRDQFQTYTTYGFSVNKGSYRWQEFTAGVKLSKLTRVQLNVSTGSEVEDSDALIVQIRNADGTIMMAEGRVAGSALPTSGWVSINLQASLQFNALHRIYVTRALAHSGASNIITWRSSGIMDGDNVYPQGSNDVAPAWSVDYAFRTYSLNVLDQRQNLTNYGFAVHKDAYRWQEFVPNR